MITPKMWDDERFVALPSDTAKLLWCYLLSGPPSRGVPGLVVGGVSMYSDALRVPQEAAREALEAVIKMRLAEFDARRRLLRIPNAPRYSPASNQNVVKGWWRRWQELPESELKHRHVESLYLARFDSNGKIRPWFNAIWEQTFGTVSKQFLNGFRNGLQPELFESDGLNRSQTVSKPMRSETETVTVTETVTETETAGGNRFETVSSAEAVELAKYLGDAIRSHRPGFDRDAMPHVAQQWAQVFDEMLRSGRDPARIRAAIDFAHRKDPKRFWRPLISSAADVNKHFCRLEDGLDALAERVDDEDFERVIAELESRGL